MPSYVSGGTADVTQYIRALPPLTTTTKPTIAQVEAFILQREAQLNATLRAAGYDTPLTHSDDVTLARLMVSQIAAVDTFIAAYEFEELPSQYEGMRDQWEKFLTGIRKGELEFASDAPEGADYPAFGVQRPPQRDPIFTERYGQSDWDE